MEQLEPAFEAPVVAAAKTRIVPAARKAAPPSPITLWIIGGVVVVGIIAAVCFFLTRKGWDEQHRDQITAMKADAEHLIQTGDPRGAYFKYQDLFAFVEGHTIQDDFIKTELEMAKGGMDTAHAEAAPLIAKEEAEEKARQQERDRIAAEQKAAELAQKQKEEADRAQHQAEKAEADARAKEQDRIEKQAAAERAIHQTARALFLKSGEFTQWQHQADSTVSTLSTGSHWRRFGLSRHE